MATANMNLTLPTNGASSGTWGTELNTALTSIDAHDHTSGKGVKVPSAGIGIDADLSFVANAATNLKSVRFDNSSSDVTAELRGLASKTDNELYWITSGGVEVKITSGTGLNTTLIGGLTGDYAATNAELRYTDASKSYDALQDVTPDHWANLKVGEVSIHEPTSGITNAIKVKSPTTLAAAYDVTLPAAVPASTEINPITIDENGVTYATGKHGPKKLAIMLADGNADTGSIAVSSEIVVANAASDVWVKGIPLLEGDRITSVEIYYTRAGGTITFDLRKMDSAGTFTTPDTSSVAAGTSFTSETMPSLTETLAAGDHYWLKITAGANNDFFNHMIVTYDHP